jgi:DNA polymerase I-like protein with 3'-5' exonuclease and polymerase domains
VIEIPVYSEQALTPRAGQVIRGILDDGFGEDQVKFRRAQFGSDRRVLVFGKAPNVTDTAFIFTYSVAQIMSKANAASVLRAGVRQFLTDPEKPPFEKPVGIYSIGQLSVLDLSKPIAIDIETSGNLGKEHTPEEVGLLSVAFYQPGHAPLVLVAPESGLDLSPHTVRQLTPLIEQTKGVYHNGKFDIRILQRILQNAAGKTVSLTNYFDTLLAHHVLNHAAGDHKLKTLARRLVGAPEWEAGLGKYTKGGGHYELIPQEMLVEYNGWDVYWTYKLFELFEPQIMQDENNQKAFMLEMSAADFLLTVEQTGLPWDQKYADKLGEALTEEADLYKVALRDQVGDLTFNPASPIQVKKYLLSLGVVVDKTDSDTLTEIINDPFHGLIEKEFCVNMLAYRRATKVKSTYVEGWQKHVRNGRVHPTYLVHGTSTGRLSSTSPNAQNVPRDKTVRKLISLGDN